MYAHSPHPSALRGHKSERERAFAVPWWKKTLGFEREPVATIVVTSGLLPVLPASMAATPSGVACQHGGFPQPRTLLGEGHP